MGNVMVRYGFIPELILASPAARARETALLVRRSAGFKAEIKHDVRIYEASPQTLLQVAAGIDDAFESAMLVGHNPGMEGFIRVTTGKPEAMPTAALAVIDLEIDSWQQVAAGCGTLRKMIRPKEEIKSFGK
jgi:phosphohistidine phosphatase